MVFAHELNHLFANQATQVETFAGVAGADQATNLHGVLAEVGHLKAAHALVPERTGLHDALQFGA